MHNRGAKSNGDDSQDDWWSTHRGVSRSARRRCRLWDGRCLTGIAALQDAQYQGRRAAVDLVNPDFVRFAESFGALGLRVTTAAEFKPALQKALQVDRPALVEIVC